MLTTAKALNTKPLIYTLHWARKGGHQTCPGWFAGLPSTNSLTQFLNLLMLRQRSLRSILLRNSPKNRICMEIHWVKLLESAPRYSVPSYTLSMEVQEHSWSCLLWTWLILWMRRACQEARKLHEQPLNGPKIRWTKTGRNGPKAKAKSNREHPQLNCAQGVMLSSFHEDCMCSLSKFRIVVVNLVLVRWKFDWAKISLCFTRLAKSEEFWEWKHVL